jgi:CheY-like chemotaxis protein
MDENSPWVKGKILVVDDEKELREMIEDVLTFNNFIASSAESGIEAIKMNQKEDFDIILMDINMPGVEGIEAVEKIKSFNPTAFIIMMAADSDEEIKNSLAKGEYACIRKPVTMKKLLKSLVWYGAGAEQIKRKYSISEDFRKPPIIKNFSRKIRKGFKSWLSSHHWSVKSSALVLAAILLGILVQIAVISIKTSMSQSVNKTFYSYGNISKKVLKYLNRNERKELRKRGRKRESVSKRGTGSTL